MGCGFRRYMSALRARHPSAGMAHCGRRRAEVGRQADGGTRGSARRAGRGPLEGRRDIRPKLLLCHRASRAPRWAERVRRALPCPSCVALTMPVRLQKPDGLPTRLDADEDVEWSTLVANQLADVRRSAENWRNGLAAMLGAVSVFSLIKGPSDVSGLEQWPRYAVGLLLLLAFACATFGAWNALAAAYGSPSPISRSDVRRLGGITGFELSRAVDAATKLKRTKLATVVGLVLLCGAVGLTWYGPRGPSVLVSVERRDGPRVCGRLGASREGHLDVEPSSSNTIRIELKNVTRMRAVNEC